MKHSIDQHIHGTLRPNTIEGFRSVVKDGAVGTYHSVSRKYLPLSVAEFQFHHNIGNNADIFRAAMTEC